MAYRASSIINCMMLTVKQGVWRKLIPKKVGAKGKVWQFGPSNQLNQMCDIYTNRFDAIFRVIFNFKTLENCQSLALASRVI